MKVIVIGLGSMGKRRIRLLSEHKDIETMQRGRRQIWRKVFYFN